MRKWIVPAAVAALMLVAATPAFAQDYYEEYLPGDLQDASAADGFDDEYLSLHEGEAQGGLDIDHAVDERGDRVVVLTDPNSGAQVVAILPPR